MPSDSKAASQSVNAESTGATVDDDQTLRKSLISADDNNKGGNKMAPTPEEAKVLDGQQPPIDADQVKVKVSNNDAAAAAADDGVPQNGDAKVDVGGGGGGVAVDVEGGAKQPLMKTFAGMGKDELMKYANDPYWVRMRWALFVLFWLIWLLMLVAAIAIVVLAPKCAPPKPLEWWQKGPIYELPVRSFKDGSEPQDGIGDFKGLLSKVSYLRDLGVGAVWLTPFYKSPQKQFGYDVQDHKQIAEEYGTEKDFADVVEQLDDNDIHTIIDFVPNHSSDEHEWFKQSVRRVEPYTDYYIWKDAAAQSAAGGQVPPNNWLSVNGGSAWTYNPTRRQYYLHQFDKSQPDLNLRNEKVVQEMKDVLRFWLDKGVHGFRVDSVSHLFEDESFQNESENRDFEGDNRQYGFLTHDKTFDLREPTIKLLTQFREVLDEYQNKDQVPRALISDASMPVNATVAYFGIKFEELFL